MSSRAASPRAEHGSASQLGLLVLLAATSGALLFASDHPLHWWPLQVVALVPMLIGLERWCASRRAAALAGAVLGVFYLVPLQLVLRFPLLMGAGLVLYLAVLWVLVAVALHAVLRWPSPLGPLAAGACAVLVEWIDVSLVPVWGTAQSFVRVWTVAPGTVQLTALTGALGLVLVSVAGQSCLARLVLGGSRLRNSLCLAILIALVAGWTGWRMSRPIEREMTVAAIGWTTPDLRRLGLQGPLETYERMYAPLARQAAGAGARLIVSPEVGFSVDSDQRPQLLGRIAGLARKLQVWLVVGVMDRAHGENRAVFVAPDGAIKGEYVKTHLIPFVERYRAGGGRPVTVSIDGATVGAVICQDDNFSDLPRAYGRRGTHIVAVPTNDWREVSPYHFENARFRPVENGYALVRAASNGISAIVSPRGKLLVSHDHLRNGPGMVTARVPLIEAGTVYSYAGDWLVVAMAVAILTGGIVWRRRRIGG